MKKKTLAMFLAFSLCAAFIVPDSAKAATSSVPREVSILDMVADDQPETDSLTILKDGSIEANGESVDLDDIVKVSPLKAHSLNSASSVSSYLKNKGYQVEKEGDGFKVSSLFSSKRLFVSGESFRNYHGARKISMSGGISLMSFDSPDDAAAAYESFKAEGYTVYPDKLYGDDMVDSSNVTYSPDVIGEYGATVSDSTNTVSLTTSPEIMGLTVSSNNIVGAQSAATIGQVGVAVVDSGVDSGSNFSSRFPGRVINGYNVLSQASSAIDDYGHGTFIASIIANNTPSNVKIVPVKAVDSNGGFTASRLAAALQYIVSNPAGINVVNLSLSICTLDSNQMDQIASYINPYIDALYSKGILVVTSAGNKNSSYPAMTADDSYPANYGKTLAVSGIAQNGGSWGAYSQSLTGSCVDFTAPGRYIRGIEASSMNMSKASASNNWSAEYLSLGDGTCIMSGTSQSTAFVSAALAHIYSYDPSYSASNAESILIRNTSKTFIGGGSGKDSTFGYGYPELSAYVHSTGVITNPDNNNNANNNQNNNTNNPNNNNTNNTTSNNQKVVSGLVDGFDVIVNDTKGTVTLVKYTGKSSSVRVEDTYAINGKRYDTILGKSTASSGVFSGNTAISIVNLGESVKASDGDASYLFYQCSNLTSLNRLPYNATDISYALYGCGKLNKLPSVPYGVTKMDYAFYNCTSATGENKVDSSVVSSAKDAYTGTKVYILVPADSLTYTTISKILNSYGKDVTLNGKTSSEIGNNENSTGNGTYEVIFHYRDNRVNVNGRETKATVKAGECIKKPANPKLKNYYFAGWYTYAGVKFNFSKKVDSPVDLYAKWISTKTAATKITKLKRVNSSYFNITYKKSNGATGYQIRYSHHKNFQNWGDVRTTKLSRKLHTVNSGTIYVRVRPYKKIGKTYYYGKWSPIKKVKL